MAESRSAPEPLLTLGSTVSQELYDFTECFLPMAERSDLGAALRKKGFKLADPNGNGLCSLAELETFVLQTLMKAYPKDPKQKDHRGDPLERGRDLFDAFRPSYIRAYNDAKDYKADTGAVLAGTKKCTADDFVTKGEFIYFCAYLCIYGAMVRRAPLMYLQLTTEHAKVRAHKTCCRLLTANAIPTLLSCACWCTFARPNLTFSLPLSRSSLTHLPRSMVAGLGAMQTMTAALNCTNGWKVGRASSTTG